MSKKIDIIEFAEMLTGTKLFPYQKQVLRVMMQDDRRFVFVGGRNFGRKLLYDSYVAFVKYMEERKKHEHGQNF